MTRVAALQLAPVIGDLAANAAATSLAIEGAVRAGAEVVVAPELCTSGYMFDSPEEAASLAIGRDHPIIAGWRRLADRAGVVLAAGFAERGEDGRLYNSAVLIPGDGSEPTVYRKLHLWDRIEKDVFTPGDATPPIVDTPVGRVAVIICYDLEFPEITRKLALAGTQLLLVPTNWPLVPRPDGERPPEVIIAMAAARASRMAIACADRAGVERGQAWNQGTTIVDADGWVVTETRDPGTILGEVELARALDKRHTDHADVFADRRPEFY